MVAEALVERGSATIGFPGVGAGCFSLESSVDDSGAMASSLLDVFVEVFVDGVSAGSSAFACWATRFGALPDDNSFSFDLFVAAFSRLGPLGFSVFDGSVAGSGASDGGVADCWGDCSVRLFLSDTGFMAGLSFFLFGFAASAILGGLLVDCDFSWVLLAELAVGLIILAIKPPSAGVVDDLVPFLEDEKLFESFPSVSCVLLAELVVGRIIRDKKSPAASEGRLLDVRVAVDDSPEASLDDAEVGVS